MRLAIITDETMNNSLLVDTIQKLNPNISIVYVGTLCGPNDSSSQLRTADLVIIESNEVRRLTTCAKTLLEMNISLNAFLVSDKPVHLPDYLLKTHRIQVFLKPFELAGFNDAIEKLEIGDSKFLEEQDLIENSLVNDLDEYIKRELISSIVRSSELDDMSKTFYDKYFFHKGNTLRTLIISFYDQQIEKIDLKNILDTLSSRYPQLITKLIYKEIVGIMIEQKNRISDYGARIKHAILSMEGFSLTAEDIHVRVSASAGSTKELIDGYKELKNLGKEGDYENLLRSKKVLDIYALEQELYENVEHCDWEKVNTVLKIISEIVDSVNKKNPVMNRAYFSHLWRSLDRTIFQKTGRRKSIPEKDQIDVNLDHLQKIEDMRDVMADFAMQLAEELGLSEKLMSNLIVEKVKEFVEVRYAEDVSLVRVASEVGLSSCHLSKLFKKTKNVNFKDFVIGVRMKHAKLLLADGTKTINEIAEKVGYLNANYFSRAFKQFTGKSPSEFSGKASKD
jgi:two-component system, response regulator YesN